MMLPLVVEPAQLALQLNDPNLLIVDLSSEENYLQGHLPGAIHLDPKRLLRGQGDVPNRIPEPLQLTEMFTQLGISSNRHVVAYDDQGGPWAGRLIWTLHCAGHTHCSFLNGHLTSWQRSGLKVESGAVTPTPLYAEAMVSSLYLADARWIQSHLTDPGVCIWDARSAPEYTGEKVVNAKFGGHIPGAQHYEWTDLLDEQQRIRPTNELLAELAAKGITPDRTVVTHCQTHRRSGLTYLVARHLGFDRVRCYDGSWFEWGNLADTPKQLGDQP